MHATLSFLGMYNYYPQLFDKFAVPEGVDKDLVVNTLLTETADLELLQIEPESVALCLGWFSERRMQAWTRMCSALSAEYDPLDEYDSTETRTPNLHRTDVRTPNLTTTGQNNGSDSTTTQRAGYNGGDLVTSDKVTTQLGTGSEMHSTGTDTTERDETGTDTTTRRGRGIPAADLLAREREAAMMDAVEYIVSDVRRNFCLLIY